MHGWEGRRAERPRGLVVTGTPLTPPGAGRVRAGGLGSRALNPTPPRPWWREQPADATQRARRKMRHGCVRLSPAAAPSPIQ